MPFQVTKINGNIDALLNVFAIFFVPDYVKLVISN
jgi:hypothetical protein